MGRDRPVALPDLSGLGQEVQFPGGRDFGAPPGAGGQQLVAAGSEPLMQFCDEAQGLVGEDSLAAVGQCGGDGDRR